MKKTVLILSVALMQACASAPKWLSVNEAGMDTPAIEKSLIMDNIEGEGKPDGKGYIPYLKALKAPPKRVALVSVYALDPANSTTSGDYKTTRWLTTSGAKSAANEIYKHGFDAMKKEFAKHGMDLLSPSEFLTDDTKKEFFTSFEMKKGTASAALGGTMNFLRGIANQGHKPVMEVADGFNEVFILNNGAFSMGTSTPDDTLANSLGSDLAKGLGVDAVLVVYSQFIVYEKATGMTEADMQMFGPNPVPVKAEEVGFFGSRPGHHYGGVRAPFNFVYIGTDTGNPADYAGYANILTAMSKKLGTYLEQKTAQN